MMERFQSSSTEFSFKGKLQTYKILQVFSLLLHCPFPAINALCLIHLTWNMLRFSMNLCMKCCCISLRKNCFRMSERSPPQEHSWFVLSNAVITRGTCQKFRKSNEVARYNRGIIIFLSKGDPDSHSPTGVRSCWWGVTTLLRKLPMNLRKWGPTVLTLWRWVSDLSDTLVN